MAVLKQPLPARALELAWWIGLASAVALFSAVALKTMAYAHEVAVSEGAVGLAVQSILEYVPIYDASRWLEPPFVIVHYTPIYYLLTAAVAWVVGPGFLAGRVVSTLATVGTAAVAGTIVHDKTRNLPASLMAGALWLSFYQVAFWGTIQRVDAAAILFEAVGLLFYMRARRRGDAGYGAIPWFVAAWATKQVMIVGFAACILDRLIEDRGKPSHAMRFASVGSVSILALLVSFIVWSNGGFWTAAFWGTVSSYADTPWVVFSNAELFFGSPWNMLLLVLAMWSAWFRPRDRLLGIYLALGMISAVVFDANLPRFFPPMLAMAILVALLLQSAHDQLRQRTALLLALVLTFGAHQLYEMRSVVRERILTLNESNERLHFAEAVRRHTTPDGAVLAQDVGMLMSADRAVTMADPLVFSILAGNNAWSGDVLVDGIRNREYEAVVLNRPIEEFDESEWTTLWIYPARSALQNNYRLAETITIDQHWRFLESTRYIYVPVSP